jgi:class 3 adenylate cyclase
MPLFKGYQVTRLLKSRKNTKDIPVIMFTSLSEVKDKFWGTHAGADAHIEKSADNFRPLHDAAAKILSVPQDIDFAALEKEGKKISDDTIIEMVNNLLDNKLFQSTVIGKLTELSDNTFSMETIAGGFFDLLHTISETEIITLMIRGTGGALYHYTANFAGFTDEIANNFSEISISDFNNLFPDFHIITKTKEDFFSPGGNQKKLVSYIVIPLTIGGEKIASVHIANTKNDYFTPGILDNINTFTGAAAPVIANALSMRELAELQKNTRTAFSRYVPVDVMDEIISNSSKTVNQSENRNVTVLFADIRDFTAASEHSDAQKVVDFLNAYFAQMGGIIISEGGHIDKFIGDAIMAVFGAFRDLENPAANAIRAAIRMLAALEDIDTSKITLPFHGLKIGIGINSGECILGNIGFQSKMDYTIIGDTVNLASRMEGLTKRYRYPLIVTEYVYNTTKDHFLFRKVDSVRVKGKKEPAGIYAIYTGFEGTGGNILRSGEISVLPSIPSMLINREAIVNYNKGLQLFEIREWKSAREYFSKAVEIDGNDFLSRLYLERALEFARTPPPDNWDGIVTLDEK